MDLEDISVPSDDSAKELSHRGSIDEGDSYLCTSESDEDTIEEQALHLFETKPNKAVDMLIEHKIISDSPAAIADFLYCNPRLSGKMVGEYLGENEERNLAVLDAFLDKMNLSDTEFDQAMRQEEMIILRYVLFLTFFFEFLGNFYLSFFFLEKLRKLIELCVRLLKNIIHRIQAVHLSMGKYLRVKIAFIYWLLLLLC